MGSNPTVSARISDRLRRRLELASELRRRPALIVHWDAPKETQTGAQWVTEFHIYGSAREGCGGYLLAEYEMQYSGFTTPPDLDGVDDDTELDRFKYFKIVSVGPVNFGVTAVNELGEGPCVDGPERPDFD